MSAPPAATINIVIIFKAIFDSISVFGVWGWVDLLGSSILLIGCLGELWMLLNKIPEHNERRTSLKGFWAFLDRAESIIRPIGIKLKIIRERKFSDLKEHLLEGLFISMVLIGVGMELCSLPFSLIESSEFNKEAEDAKKIAGETELTNLELQKRVWKLQNPATITTDERKAFMDILCEPHNVSKTNILVISCANDRQTRQFAYQVSKILEESGYGNKPSEYQFTMSNNPTIYTTYAIPQMDLKPFTWEMAAFIKVSDLNFPPLPVNPAAPFDIAYGPSASQTSIVYRNEYPFTDNEPDVVALFSGTNAPDALLGSVMIMYPSGINESTQPLYEYLNTKDPNVILYGICEVLHDIGITVGKNTTQGMLPPGQVGIYIPSR